MLRQYSNRFCIVEDAVNVEIMDNGGDHFVGIVEYVDSKSQKFTQEVSGHTNTQSMSKTIFGAPVGAGKLSNRE